MYRCAFNPAESSLPQQKAVAALEERWNHLQWLEIDTCHLVQHKRTGCGDNPSGIKKSSYALEHEPF